MAPQRNERRIITAALFAGLGLSVPAWGQSASLVRMQVMSPPGVPIHRPVSVDEVSLVRLPPAPTYQLHDSIHIRVTETIINRVNAQLNKRRNTRIGYGLEDFIVILSGLRLRDDSTIRNERPAIDIVATDTEQKQFQFNRNDILKYELQADVVEIKPNGNLVLEASGEVSVNNEVYTYKMTGIVSPKDIDPRDRSVESTYVQSRRIDLRVVGAARDALKRGYITALLEWFQPI